MEFWIVEKLQNVCRKSADYLQMEFWIAEKLQNNCRKSAEKSADVLKIFRQPTQPQAPLEALQALSACPAPCPLFLQPTAQPNPRFFCKNNSFEI